MLCDMKEESLRVLEALNLRDGWQEAAWFKYNFCWSLSLFYFSLKFRKFSWMQAFADASVGVVLLDD